MFLAYIGSPKTSRVVGGKRRTPVESSSRRRVKSPLAQDRKKLTTAGTSDDISPTPAAPTRRPKTAPSSRLHKKGATSSSTTVSKTINRIRQSVMQTVKTGQGIQKQTAFKRGRNTSPVNRDRAFASGEPARSFSVCHWGGETYAYVPKSANALQGAVELTVEAWVFVPATSLQ